ncbi:hypothetical protein BC939DRAFT_148143 [Gamsiella multidivaricata]|uniref:uncharacterized protein n=1 Tax=Gamsiella multidivaricata TaxID=101098 RepID=UPI00221FC4A2|nr:uncharacterized protein BC939DRAFT_148143 [Gamsiella multidivaricata]KAI7831721.1 hypothetical protein BC939DRAFT_148143 [Gamsiella multidivaricata]
MDFLINVFQKEVARHVNADVDYIAQVGVLSPNSSNVLRTSPSPWEPSTSPSNVNATEWAIAQALEATSPASVRHNGSDDDDHINSNDDHNGDNDDSTDDGDDDNDIAGPTTGAVAIAASRHIIRISRVEGALQVIQNAQLDKNSRNTIYVPPSLSTAENYVKAHIFLWKYQSADYLAYLNLVPSPRKNLVLRNTIKQYGENLVYTKTTKGETRTSTCSVRNPHTAKQLIQIASFTWRKLLVPGRVGKRVHDQARFPHIREHLNIPARHHILLRDEDMGNLMLSDVFSVQTRHNVPGSALALGIVFSLPRGKTNQRGVNIYTIVYRHRNFVRCTVAVFG